MNSRERFLGACRGEPVDRPPVWIMRQAGRTLPEYHEVRRSHSFWEVCTTPELAAEVTLQPLRRFPMDVAVIFSDILVVPAAMGIEVGFSPELSLTPALRTTADIARLETPDISAAVSYLGEALEETRRELGEEKALLGFAGAPFTLASYMVEGGGSKHFNGVRELMYGRPREFEGLMARLSDAVGDLLEMQIEASADAVQLFDTRAGDLAPEDFSRYVLPHVRSIVQRVQRLGAPVIYYANGIGSILEQARATGPDVLGVDWRVDLAEVRRRTDPHQVVQGNLDPGVLFAPAEVIRERVFRMLDQTRGLGHIVNLGHGVIPETPIEGIDAFTRAVGEWAAARGGPEGSSKDRPQTPEK